MSFPHGFHLEHPRIGKMDEHSHSMDDNVFLHVANVIYLCSYSVRDILWLRALTVLAMLLAGACYWTCSQYGALGWQGAFLAINIFQIGLLVYERRPVKLSDVEQRLHDGPLHTLTARQVQRFNHAAEWQTIGFGEVLLEEDKPLEHLILVLSGHAKVVTQEREIALIESGQFAGEMSFLTGGNTTASVVALDTILYARWPKSYIEDLMQREQELSTALQAALGTDLVRKLVRDRNKLLQAADE